MRAYVVVVAFILGAIFTPPDVVSQFMLALPICMLYELGMLLAGFITKAKTSKPNSPA
jgi:sec-independent protein translocase protein TatC